MGTALGKINVETPKYELVEQRDGFEVRLYRACVVAEVSYDPAETKSGRDGGFMILASYIGAVGQPKNQSPDQNPQKIAMTAPVITKDSPPSFMVVEKESDAPQQRKMVTMQFVLPSNLTRESAPRPTDSRVRIEEVPEKKYAVSRFKGVADERLAREKVEDLKKKLENSGYKIVGDWILARYNPPWTPGFLRTNEVMIPVE